MKYLHRTLCLGLLLIPFLLSAQERGSQLADKTRILFILDASRSMLDDMEMDKSKMSVAKEVLTDLIDSLRNYPRLEVALRVYGSNPQPGRDACDDTHLEIPFSDNNHDAIINSLREIEPKGGTPIAYSLEQTVNDFPKDGRSYNVVILITDGAESCKGDPCAVTRKLREAGVFLEPYIISLDMKGEFRHLFDCMGKQFTVNDIPSFRDALDESVRTTLEGPTVTIEILNGRGKPYRSDLTISMYDDETKELKYQLIHYMAEDGTTDTLLLPPGVDYDIEVATIPPISRKSIRFIEGKHTTYQIPAPQGNISIMMRSASYYDKPVLALIKDKQGKIIYTQAMNSNQKYLAGNYDMEVLTRPPAHFRNVSVTSDATSIINVPEPGILTIDHKVPGVLSVFAVYGENLTPVENRSVDSTQEKIVLQPGKYRVAFRAKNAKGSKFTVVKEFEVQSRATTNISIY